MTRPLYLHDTRGAVDRMMALAILSGVAGFALGWWCR